MFFILGAVAVQAQQKKKDPCADIKAMYDVAVYYLDSTVGVKNVLEKQLDSLQRNVTKARMEVKNLQKSNTEARSQLESAKKLIIDQKQLMDDQAAEIKRLEAEVQRLAKKSSG